MFMFRKRIKVDKTPHVEAAPSPAWLEKIKSERKRRLALDFLKGVKRDELVDKYGRTHTYEVIRLVEREQLTTKQFNDKYECKTCRI